VAGGDYKILFAIKVYVLNIVFSRGYENK